MTRLRAAWFVALALLGLAAPARAEKLAKAEIAKRGKAATALVVVPDRGTGTAFCVHPSGLFVTNEHVVWAVDSAEIQVVVDSGLKTQRVLAARVVRRDKDRDLALLRATTKDDLPSLPLGSLDGVGELSEVVAFGFPLGSALSTDKKDHPAISVNAGTVAALRRKEGEIVRLQVDVSVTYGNSGGPVLDENAKVVGVVVSGIPGQRGINLAIPVSHVAVFLAAPDLEFTPPELRRAGLEEPQEFKARAVSLLPDAKEPSLRLVLASGDAEPREFPMEKRDGVWVARAAPVPKGERGRVEINARLGRGSVNGFVEDAVVKVAGKPMRLSALRRIDTKPKPAAVLADGSTVAGEVAGLGPVDVRVGDQTPRIDLSKAERVQVVPPPEVAEVRAAVVAFVDGKEVARREAAIPVRDATAVVPADPSTVAITPPALAENQSVRRLPETFDEYCLAGGGRYLILRLPKLRKLAVFDVNEARVTNYIPLAEDRVIFAAGLDRVVVGLPEAKVLERWNLTTFEREARVETEAPLKTMTMGHASNGPILVGTQFVDLGTLRPLPMSAPSKVRPVASADGTVFAEWYPDSAAGGRSAVFVLEGSQVRHHAGGEFGHLVPALDGRTLFTARGLATEQLKQVPDDARFGYCMPAVRGNFFLALTAGDKGKPGGFLVYAQGQAAPIARMPEAAHGLTFTHMDHDMHGAWNRVFLVPQANVILLLPTTNDRVVLYKFDVDAALEKSGVDYLVVVSPPPPVARPGTTFKHPISVKARHKPVSFKLDSAPKGMVVSADGVVEWAVPADAPPGDSEAIMTIKDGKGTEVFHTFPIRVRK